MNEKMMNKIISEMDMEEKAKFLTTDNACISHANKENNIPSIILADGATGANGTHIVLDYFGVNEQQPQEQVQQENEQESANLYGELIGFIAKDGESARKDAEGSPYKTGFVNFLETRRNPAGAFVSFPSGANIGACFDEDIAHRVGEAVGQELRAANVSTCLGPNVDIMRDPLGGRNYEMYGEDPVLVERTAAAFIKGMQSTGTMACAKHFIANNQETNRQTKNINVSTRTLRELYARGFKSAVKNGGVKTVMSAYTAVNGVFSSYNKMLLTDWLKSEWGFDGFVVSDWGAVTGKSEEAIAAGMDMILDGPFRRDSKELVEAVKQGKLSEDRINDAVKRIFKAILWQQNQIEEYSFEYNQKDILQTAFDVIVDSAVLLKNDHVLPLKKDDKVSFYGSKAKNTMECGSGSTYVTTTLHSNLFDECEKEGLLVSLEDMNNSDYVIYAAGASGGENADRESMALDLPDENTITEVLKAAKSIGKKTIVVLNIAAPVDMRTWIEYADAIICEFVPGCMGGKAMASIIAGKSIPCGRLPMTFPLKLNDTPASPFSVGEYDQIYYSEGIFNGYRWYDAKELPVQFPFGYGLSYTTFESCVDDISEKWDIEKEPTFSVQVKVKNTGTMKGAEVIQLYMGKVDSRIPMPQKELMAYKKVYLEAGEEKVVTLTVNRDDLYIYDPQKEKELIPIGAYRISIGTDANTMFYKEHLEVLGQNPYKLDGNSTLEEILSSDAARQIVSRRASFIETLTEEELVMGKKEKIQKFLERYLINSIPNAIEMKALLDEIFEELAKL